MCRFSSLVQTLVFTQPPPLNAMHADSDGIIKGKGNVTEHPKRFSEGLRLEYTQAMTAFLYPKPAFQNMMVV